MTPSLNLPALRRRLLRWFDRHRRDLPWREDRDPYRIWVSEVMLQQTTVATVSARFGKFITAFPTVRALAEADEQKVLRHWEGLGYYRRARNLHAAAKRLVTDHGGELPDDPDVWRSLSGVGRYILGAVLSQAFDRRLPIVEANTRRVLARLFGHRGDLQTGPGIAWLWQKAEELLPRRRVGDFNQAMMEIGSLVCRPEAPRCDECPLARECVAHRDGTQTEIPTPVPRPTIVQVEEVAVVVRDDERVLLVQRPDDGRWAGMWEFPHRELTDGEDHDSAAKSLLEELGVAVHLGTELMTVRHSVTHHRIRMVCLEATHREGDFRQGRYRDGRWVEPAELVNYPVSSPQRKLADVVASSVRQRHLF